MAHSKDTTMTDTFERFAWAGRPSSALQYVRYGTYGYRTKDEAIANLDVDPDGKRGKLYRITVEEVEVPEPTWWFVDERYGGIISYSIGNNVGHLPTSIIQNINGAVHKSARVKAFDQDAAIAAAQDAWRDLAAKLGGAK